MLCPYRYIHSIHTVKNQQPRLTSLRRLVVRVGFRHHRFDLLAPVSKHFTKFPGLFRHFTGQVVPFSNVFFEVVQLDRTVLVEFDQLPIAFAHGAEGRICPGVEISSCGGDAGG